MWTYMQTPSLPVCGLIPFPKRYKLSRGPCTSSTPLTGVPLPRIGINMRCKHMHTRVLSQAPCALTMCPLLRLTGSRCLRMHSVALLHRSQSRARAATSAHRQPDLQVFSFYIMLRRLLSPGLAPVLHARLHLGRPHAIVQGLRYSHRYSQGYTSSSDTEVLDYLLQVEKVSSLSPHYPHYVHLRSHHFVGAPFP